MCNRIADGPGLIQPDVLYPLNIKTKHVLNLDFSVQVKYSMPLRPNGVFTLDDTENETNSEGKSDNYGFHYNMQNTSHCTETLSLMPLATFSFFIGRSLGIVLSVAQCEHTIKGHGIQSSLFLFTLTCALISNVAAGDSNTLSSDGEVLLSSSCSCSRRDGRVSASDASCAGRGPPTSSTGGVLRDLYLYK